MEFEKQPSMESSEKPPVLYRAFTVDPELLTVELLTEDLKPGTIDKEDSTKIGDGNELGVYMSTNRNMVEIAYAHAPNSSVKSPQYNNRGSIMEYIPLPSCGVVVEVITENLPIRKPEISEVLQGVYNNGFEGQEWISDSVPSDHARVIKLILSSHSNDTGKFVVTVDGSKKEDLQKAIDSIKTEFEKRKEEAIQFRNFLEGLKPDMRLNEFMVKRKWQKFQEEFKKDIET